MDYYSSSYVCSYTSVCFKTSLWIKTHDFNNPLRSWYQHVTLYLQLQKHNIVTQPDPPHGGKQPQEEAAS